MSTTPMEPEIRNPLFARFYARVLEPLSKRDRNRERLLAELYGRVLELGCGAGINFVLYASTVSEVIAVEPEPYLRRRAEQAAASANVSIKVVAGQADRLPLEDSSVDHVVCSLVLCSVPDQASALAELHRVLRPGGELHFYEHVVAHNPVGHALQRAADATFWPRAFGNCHTTRDTRAAIEQAGFQIERCKRLVFPDTEPPLPHILGVARRAQ
jgi:ubiquinone/menaquinone biosynthesis C-methylase UbiE